MLCGFYDRGKNTAGRVLAAVGTRGKKKDLRHVLAHPDWNSFTLLSNTSAVKDAHWDSLKRM